ncbi:MAG: SWIM zinc finger family protein [Patescibacteria group bacterium]
MSRTPVNDATTLSSFEEELDDKIVQRGKEYFRKGRVRDLAEMDDGVWRALIQGTEAYDTTITMEDGRIARHRCNCPYDLGQYCKHEVALLYAIREQMTGSADDDGQEGPGQSSSTKRRTVRQQVDDAVRTLSEEQLRAFVAEQAFSNQAFRARVLRSAPTQETVPQQCKKQEYIGLIRECMEDNADRHGFIGWEEAFSASMAAHELCVTAEQHLECKRYDEALPIGQALLEAIYPDLGQMDDSNGEFGSCIEEGWNILRTIAEKLQPESDLAGQLFQYCLDQAGNEAYEGWYAADDFFDIAVTLVLSGEREKVLMERIEEVMLTPRKKADADSSKGYSDPDFKRKVEEHRCGHNSESAARLMLAVLQRVGKTEEACEFILQHLQYPDIRKELLKELVENGKLDEAKEAAKKGIRFANAKGHIGTARDFEEWLVTIAEKEGDTETQQSCLEKFYLDSCDMKAYRRWKQSFTDAKMWEKACNAVIAKLDKENRTHEILSIYEEEGCWEEFRDCVLKECNRLQKQSARHYESAYHFLLQYEDRMMERYPDDFAPLALASVQPYLKNNTGRATYQEICRLLRRLRKHGYEDGVEKVREQLRTQFKNRRALLEELGKVS